MLLQGPDIVHQVQMNILKIPVLVASVAELQNELREADRTELREEFNWCWDSPLMCGLEDELIPVHPSNTTEHTTASHCCIPTH